MNILGEVRRVIISGSDNAAGLSGSVQTTTRQYTVSTGGIVITDGTLFTIAPGQKAFIQNLDDAAVYVKYGAGASSTDFNFVLKAGSAANDGNGGSVVIDDFAGAISIAAASGDPRVVAWRLS